MDKHRCGISSSWLSSPGPRVPQLASATAVAGGQATDSLSPSHRRPLPTPPRGRTCIKRGKSVRAQRQRRRRTTRRADGRSGAARFRCHLDTWIRHGKRGEGHGGTHAMVAGSGDFATIDAGFFFRDRRRKKRPPLSGAEEESEWEPLSAQVRSDPHQVGAQRNQQGDFCFGLLPCFFFGFFYKQTFPFTHHF